MSFSTIGSTGLVNLDALVNLVKQSRLSMDSLGAPGIIEPKKGGRLSHSREEDPQYVRRLFVDEGLTICHAICTLHFTK